MNHGWNHIYVNGGWKFIDVTWDDPGQNSGGGVFGDLGPTYVRYTYFLLTNMGGVDNNHYGDSADIGRAAIGSFIPRQRGVPDGWY